jgi:hypothetical protein
MLINVAPKTMQNGDSVLFYTDTVDTSGQTFTFPNSQERVRVRNLGTYPITYTVGSQTGSLGPSEVVDVTETISQVTLVSSFKTQAFEIWADELGSNTQGVDLSSITSQLADKAKLGEIIDLNKWGIKNDGTNSRSTTDGINNALQWYSTNGYKRVVLPSGTYLIDGVNETLTGQAKNQDTGIKIPSNMIFEMNNDTILKVEPNNSCAYACIFLSKTQNNIKIIGGQILGDRKTHDYTGDAANPTHEYGYGIHLYGASDIIIEGLTIKDCTGDCIMLYSPGMINYDVNNPYTPPSRIKITKCTLDSARRNNISITACDHVIVESCEILNAGINDGVHDGTAPRYGIDLEGYGEGSIDYETPLKVVVKNNKFVGNVNTSVGNFDGYEVVFSENFSDNLISYGYGTDTVISNNVFKRTDNTKTAIAGLGVSQGQLGNHVTITGNTIDGFATGIDLRGKNVSVTGNTIFNTSIGISSFQGEQILIEGNALWKCSTKAFSFLQATLISMIGNLVRDTPLAVEIDQTSTHIRVINNTLEEYGIGIKVIGGSCTIKGNTLNQINYTGTKSYHLWFDTNTSILIESNTFKKPEGYVLFGSGGTGTGRARIVKNVIEEFTGFPPINLTTAGKYELVSNEIIGAVNNANAIVVSAGITGALIVGNKIYTIAPFALQNGINTSAATSSKIISNVCLNGGISSAASDTLNSNIVV